MTPGGEMGGQIIYDDQLLPQLLFQDGQQELHEPLLELEHVKPARQGC